MVSRIAALASCLFLVACDSGVFPDPEPEPGVASPCDSAVLDDREVFPFPGDSTWSFDTVRRSSGRSGSWSARGEMTWTFGETACVDSVWTTEVKKVLAVYSEANPDFPSYRRSSGELIELGEGRVTLTSGDNRIEFLATGPIDHDELEVGDTLVVGDVTVVGGEGIVEISRYFYMGFGQREYFDATRTD